METQISKKLSYRYPNLGMTYSDFNLASKCNIDGNKCLNPIKDYEEIQSNPKNENLISVSQITSAFAINCNQCPRNKMGNKIKN
jgi:hypothetical protein